MDRRQRAELAIRAVQATYLDAARMAMAEEPARLSGVKERALATLDKVAIEIQPEADDDLLELLEETRRQIRQQA